MKIKITREKRFQGMLMPYIIFIDYNVNHFKHLIDLVHKAKSEDELRYLQNLYDKTNHIFIKNGETLDVETSNDELIIFATNGFYENSDRYPLSISNMIVCKEDSSLLLKSKGSLLGGVKLVLEEKI